MRNMTDDMLRAVARNGGVVMVNFFSGFVDEDYRKALLAQRPERNAALDALEKKLESQDRATRYREYLKAQVEWMAKIPRPPLESLINHIDHVAKVAGIDHVGLGSDFDGITSTPVGIDSAADLPKITEALYARGYRKADLRKILGGNLLRVFKECERVSRELRAAQAAKR
jgi:membrane dipeptidase